jgi:ABC-type transporter Mla subunit MlaD
MGARAPRTSAILAALGFTLVCFLLIVFVWRSFGGIVPLEAQGYRFHVLFSSEASQLSPGADVRIAGVNIGEVSRVGADFDTVDAEVELQPEFAPLPSDSKAIVRTKTLLGEGFIELTPGTPDAPKLADGATLPAGQVERAEQIDRVVGTFDEPTRAAFKTFLGGLAKSIHGRGEDLNNALGNIGPTTENIGDLVGIMDDERTALQSLIRDTATTFDAIGGQEGALRDLIDSGEQVFSATADRNQEVTRTVNAFPGLLRELRATLAEGRATSDEAAPTLHALRPVAPAIRPAFERANKLAPELEKAFTEVLPVVNAAQGGIPAGTRMVQAVGPMVDALYPAGRELVPVLDFVQLYRRELVASFANAASTTQGSTKRPHGPPLHYVRGIPMLTPEQIYGHATRLWSNRYNPYIRPGGLTDLAEGNGYRSLSCAHTQDKGRSFAFNGFTPKCIEQKPWGFQGEKRSYPHIRRRPPG